MKSLIAIFFTLTMTSAHEAKAHVQHPDACEHALSSGAELQKLSNGTPLWSTWGMARLRAHEIEDAAKSFSEQDKKDFALVLKAVDAAVTKHQEAFAHSKNWKKMDVPRHMEILKSIANFDGKKPKFSLYKIKRAIEGRHSLREYADCE